MTENKINAVFKSGMNFTAEVNGHKIEIDTDEAGGGKNIGTRPKALMLASLAGCTGLDVVSILNKMRVNFSDFSISVEGHLTETEPKIYDTVIINYVIKVNKEDQSKVEKAVNLSREKYCGVSKMFESFAKVSSKIDYV
ncbi:MAG: OsmC family protein [Bacteroidota bacterium]|nr:OsmC family protein [Bacteroidota bacterium]